MKETMGWVLTGILAGVAMFSLATAHDPAPSMNDPITLPRANLATLEEAARPGGNASALADAYFSIARGAEAQDGAQSDWLIRHQMTLKGFDAEQGLNLAPESPELRTLSPADEAPLRQAFARLQDEIRRNTQSARGVSGEIVALTAALQARYDWWVLGCEAAWSRDRTNDARQRFEDTVQALAHARARGALAAL